MGKRAPKPLPAPTMEERAAAAVSARALKAMLGGAPRGDEITAFIDGGRRRECIRTWSNLPGFIQGSGGYRHVLLPGWQYKADEIGAEMIPDLETLAERGVRPTEPTR